MAIKFGYLNGVKRLTKGKDTLPTTSGLASCGVYARGKFSGNLKVSCPSELLRSPARTPSRRNVVGNARRTVQEDTKK